MALQYHLQKRAINHATRLGVIQAKIRHAKMCDPGYTIVQAVGYVPRFWYFEHSNKSNTWKKTLHFARNNPVMRKTNPIYIVCPDGISWLITKKRQRAQNPPDPYQGNNNEENQDSGKTICV